VRFIYFVLCVNRRFEKNVYLILILSSLNSKIVLASGTAYDRYDKFSRFVHLPSPSAAYNCLIQQQFSDFFLVRSA
jgi:hypothetical protein